MLINDIVKNFISEQIRFDNYKNIQLTTKRIKECNSGVTNSMIFDELINLENGNIIQIQQAARSGILNDSWVYKSIKLQDIPTPYKIDDVFIMHMQTEHTPNSQPKNRAK